MNFADEIRSLCGRKPFTPFVIVLKNGQRLDVVNRWRVAMNPSEVVVLPPGQTHEWFAQEEIDAIESPDIVP
jgi:hypothetical protein